MFAKNKVLPIPLFQDLSSYQTDFPALFPETALRHMLRAALGWRCVSGSSRAEPPQLNWSTAIFRKQRTKNVQQATEARRDCLEVTAG